MHQFQGNWVQSDEMFRIHAWSSFHFDKKAETNDGYVQRIWKVTEMLSYGESQILEVFKNKLPSCLYCVLFPLDKLHVAVDTVKRILT